MSAPDAALRDQILEHARQVADERGWTWREPVELVAGLRDGEPVWVIRTNALMRGTNIRLVLCQADLAVVEAGYLPR